MYFAFLYPRPRGPAHTFTPSLCRPRTSGTSQGRTSQGAATGSGTATATGGTVTFSDEVALAGGGVTITTGATGGNILFSDTLNGTQTLGLTAGTGNIDFDAIVGGGNPLGKVTVSSAGTITSDLAFSAAGLEWTSTGVTLLDGLVTLWWIKTASQSGFLLPFIQ